MTPTNDATTVLDPEVRWIVVAAPSATAERYLWSFCTLVRSYPATKPDQDFNLILVTGDRAGEDAQQQADRYASGLYSARVFGSYAEARAAITELQDYQLKFYGLRP